MKKGRVMMDSKSNMTSSATCQRGFRAVSEITVKNLANYLKLDYGSLAEEDIRDVVGISIKFYEHIFIQFYLRSSH